MGPKQGLHYRVKMEVEVMVIKGHCTFPRSPEVEAHHQM